MTEYLPYFIVKCQIKCLLSRGLALPFLTALQFCLPNQILLLHNFMCFSLYNDDPIAVTDPIKEDNPFYFIIELKKKRLKNE